MKGNLGEEFNARFPHMQNDLGEAYNAGGGLFQILLHRQSERLTFQIVFLHVGTLWRRGSQ